jgi:argininosuccinate lyase
LSLAAMAGMVRDMTPDIARMRAFAGTGFATATDLADWLVRTLRLPFRDAHHVTGTLVARAEVLGVDLAGLSLAEMQAVEPRIDADVFGVLTVDASIASRTSYGGTAGENVAREAARWLAALRAA